MIYLMAPYTNADARVRATRFEVATLVAGELMQQFPYDWIFSPITQGHATVPFLPRHMAHNHKFWMAQCEHALRAADRVFLFPGFGWQFSKGIDQELTWCQEWDKPVIMLDCADFFVYQAAKYRLSYPDLHDELLRNYASRDALLHGPEHQIIQRYKLSTKSIIVHTETNAYTLED